MGVILLRYQRGIEKRATSKEYAYQLSVRLADLRTALTQTNALSFISAMSAVPKSALDAIAVLQGAPLTLWRESLPKQAHLIALALELQKSFSAYNTLAAEADQLLQHEVRAFNHQRGAISANDAVYHMFGVGMLFEVPIEKLMPWLVSNGPTTPDPYVNAWAQISQHPRLAELGPPLCRARQELNTIAQQLVVAIDA